jgi:hypothetical protein
MYFLASCTLPAQIFFAKKVPQKSPGVLCSGAQEEGTGSVVAVLERASGMECVRRAEHANSHMPASRSTWQIPKRHGKRAREPEQRELLRRQKERSEKQRGEEAARRASVGES